MKSVKYTFILILLIGLSMPSVSGKIETPAQDSQLSDWIVPDCRNVTGTHCFTYTTDEGLSFAHQPTLRRLTYAYGLAVMDSPNTLLAANIGKCGQTNCSLLLRSVDAGCSWDEIAEIPVVSQLSLVAAPGGQAYAWSPGRAWFYWFDGQELHEREAPEYILGFAVDPRDAAHIRVGTRFGQLYESFDNGEHFSKLGVPTSDWISNYTVRFDPDNWDNVLCGGKGAFRTTDAGQNWQPIEIFDAELDIVHNFIYSTDNHLRVWARANMYSTPEYERCILVSSDGGVHFEIAFSERDEAVDQNGIVRPVLLSNVPTWAPHPDNSDILYFIHGHYRDDYGTDFFRYDLATDEFSVEHTDALDGIASIAFNPADANVMYVGLKEESVTLAKADAGGVSSRDITARVSPNPFNPTANISFSLPEAAHVRLDIYNINGQRVGTLVNEYLSAGEHSASWNGSSVASGMYFYRLQAGETVQTEKMILLK